MSPLSIPRSPATRPFSFGHLIEKMAGKNNPSEFIKRWLVSWEENLTVNAHPLPARKQIRELLIDPWKRKDGFAGRPDADWIPNFKNAPFRLLAIVNRTDLAELPAPPPVTRNRGGGYGGFVGGGGIVSAGEGRFVFAALDPQGDPLPGNFTVIFEYRLQVGSQDLAGITRWARDWHALGKFETIDGGYLAQLATITNNFTSGLAPQIGDVAQAPAPESAIRQIRTSEAAFDPEREFREFELNKDGFLKPKTLAATPAVRFERFRVTTLDNNALADLINDNAEDIKSGTFTLPTSLKLSDGSNAPFLAARALIPEGGGKTFHWDARFIRDDEARRVLSFNTCNGCHAAETDTDSCLHIHPRAAGEPAQLSKFLEIGKVSKVANPGAPRHSVRLAEMDRRTDFFEALLHPDLSIKMIQTLKRELATRAGH